MLFESFGAQFLPPVYAYRNMSSLSELKRLLHDRFPILDPSVYTLRIHSIFRIGGTIYRNERKTDARVLASVQNGFVTRRRDFLTKMHRRKEGTLLTVDDFFKRPARKYLLLR